MILTLYVTFDADLPYKGNFSVEIERWRLNVGDHSVHQNIPGLKSTLKLADKDLCHTSFTLLIFLPSRLYVANGHSRP